MEPGVTPTQAAAALVLAINPLGQVTGFSVPLPVSRIEEESGNRLVERDRPNRDGAKIDDTGAKARRWVLTLDYLNGSTEPTSRRTRTPTS
ncbi:MAG TPA: DNA circularization N-terminal domain-containing protein [Minicystis sp.]|nr:DNA circularization N-terminal domain-containing protein [Minicystis sp.]